jgi:hypothetical protein
MWQLMQGQTHSHRSIETAATSTRRTMCSRERVELHAWLVRPCHPGLKLMRAQCKPLRKPLLHTVSCMQLPAHTPAACMTGQHARHRRVRLLSRACMTGWQRWPRESCCVQAGRSMPAGAQQRCHRRTRVVPHRFSALTPLNRTARNRTAAQVAMGTRTCALAATSHAHRRNPQVTVTGRMAQEQRQQRQRMPLAALCGMSRSLAARMQAGCSAPAAQAGRVCGRGVSVLW